MNGMLFSCSNDEDLELSAYQSDVETMATGEEEEQTPPPLPDEDED